ncbi:MAG: hypothetical protein GXP28_10330 [Planctomycetes bacterium]|nr:hypothetical protein [Planctomycetota bacterium]
MRSPRKRWLIFLLLLFVAAVVAAPTIIANTPLRNLLAKVVLVDDWRFVCKQASLSWTGRQTLTGVSIVDVAGNPLLTAETISLERSLLSLAANQNDLGKLTIVRPIVRLETRAEGSNLEDFLAALDPSETSEEGRASSSTSELVAIAIEITDGLVQGFDEPSQQQWRLSQTNFAIELGRAARGFTMNGSMNLSSEPNGIPGRIQIQFHQIAENQNQLDLLAEHLPLTPLEPFLSRIVPGSRLAGTASSTARIRWTQTPQGGLRVQTSGQLDVVQLDATAEVLSGDRLQCKKLSVPWELSLDGDHVITIGQLSADAGWAQFELSGLVTLEELASLSTSNLPKQKMNLTGSVKLDQLAAMLPHALQLREGVQIDSGELKFQAAGKPSAAGAAWSAAVTVQEIAGSDGRRTIRWEQPIHAQVELAETPQGPQVKKFSLSAPFAKANFQTAEEEVAGNFQFDLGLLSEELGQLVDLDAWQFRGTGEGTLSLARKSDHQFEGSAKIDLTNLHMARDRAMAIDEPRVQFSGDCRWDSANKSLVSRETQLISSSLSFRSRDVSLQLGESSAATATGDVAFRANLERLASIFGMVGQGESTWPRGTTTGTLKLSSNAEQLQADFSATTEHLQVVRTVNGRPDIVWAEPQLKTLGKAIYTIDTDRLELQDVQLTGQTIRLSGSATLEQMKTVQTAGTLEYQEEALDQLLASYLGPEVRFQGDRQVRFQVSGSLADSETHWSRRWNIATDAGWSTATVYGLPLSAGRVQGTLRDGQLQFVPLNIGVGQGRLTVSPQVIFDPYPQQLLLPQGPLISQVQISPQVSETMLKYVAPMVAGATRAEGNFSVVLQETKIPLDDPKRARVVGRLDVHQMQVSPGPMVAQLITLIEQFDRLTQGKQLFQAASTPSSNNGLTINNRQIDFQVAEGRVYHRNLEFEIDGVPVRSQGSVGFDQTLVLELEIPIQEKWIKRQRALQSLAGQTIKIPIRGTFSKPQIDERAVANLSRQMLQGVATEAIGGEINRALEKLFK